MLLFYSSTGALNLLQTHSLDIYNGVAWIAAMCMIATYACRKKLYVHNVLCCTHVCESNDCVLYTDILIANIWRSYNGLISLWQQAGFLIINKPANNASNFKKKML